MKLYLENGIAFFKDMGYIPGAPLKIELEIPGIDYTKFMVSVKINDLPSRTCKKSFEIKHIQLEEMDILSIKVIVKHRGTGIKQVRLGETTCTSGTDIRYKAVWANQAASTKEAQLHAIGINY